MRDADNIEATARRLRLLLGIDGQLRPDMITVIFKLKRHGLIKNYIRMPDAQMKGSEAYYDPNSRLLHISERTFRAANDLSNCSTTERRRARYTIAHEVGHIVLGHSEIRHRGESNAYRKSAKGNAQDEREAEQFAAAFLAPAHLVG